MSDAEDEQLSSSSSPLKTQSHSFFWCSITLRWVPTRAAFLGRRHGPLLLLTNGLRFAMFMLDADIAPHYPSFSHFPPSPNYSPSPKDILSNWKPRKTSGLSPSHITDRLLSLFVLQHFTTDNEHCILSTVSFNIGEVSSWTRDFISGSSLPILDKG